MERVLGFLKRYFSNYYTLHRSDLAARAAPLDPRLYTFCFYTKFLSFYRHRFQAVIATPVKTMEHAHQQLPWEAKIFCAIAVEQIILV